MMWLTSDLVLCKNNKVTLVQSLINDKNHQASEMLDIGDGV